VPNSIEATTSSQAVLVTKPIPATTTVGVNTYQGINTDVGLGMDPPPDSWSNASVGDVHLAAWPDFYYGYIFTSKTLTSASAGRQTSGGGGSGWVGGYNLKSLEGAERYSYAAYRAYRDAAPSHWLNHTSLNSSYMGTCTGLTKMPYIRDGRRSVGIGNFVIDINYTKKHPSCSDCIALMGHGFDIWGHRMMQKPINNDEPGIAKCAAGDAVCEAYPGSHVFETNLNTKS
jgi:hypothetical protein